MELRWQRPQLEIPLPPACETVVEVVVKVNPWLRGGHTHTQVAEIGAFSFQKPAASKWVVSFLDVELH